MPANLLLCLGAVGVVHDHTPCEPRLHCLLCDELHLSGILRIELEHCFRTTTLCVKIRGILI